MNNQVEIVNAQGSGQYGISLTVLGQFSGSEFQVVAINGYKDKITISSNVLHTNGTSHIVGQRNIARTNSFYSGKTLTTSFVEPPTGGYGTPIKPRRRFRLFFPRKQRA